VVDSGVKGVDGEIERGWFFGGKVVMELDRDGAT
jgi:hypothetical protein